MVLVVVVCVDVLVLVVVVLLEDRLVDVTDWLALALGAAITSTISFVWLRWRLGYLERRQ